METRKCKKCPNTYDLTEKFWYIRKETGTITTHTCKECVKKASKTSRDNALSKDRASVNKTAWSRRIQNNYGITLEAYTAIMEAHTECTICGKNPSGKFSDKLVYDHCHTTGKFRGVLCNKCNIGIGALGDTSEDLKNALEYLLTAEKEIASNSFNE